ncbi:UNVERIFIED_CONTAM: hypothetical protein Slati_3011300 [Sesamum latifolium]|uniref:Uncharacterized protein n=1 Tax=Sesamum latifolium TaxID=2727402 RepID=A0AAW2VG48_9LAMI
MLMSEEETKVYEEDTGELEEQIGEVGRNDVTVSLNAMCGSAGRSTLRVVGALGYKVEHTTPMEVRVADGSRVLNRFFYPKLCWEIQGHQFSYPVRVLKLGGCDFVLGCDWLSANSHVELDFHQPQVTITNLRRKVILKAISSKVDLKLISTHSLGKLLRKENHVVSDQLFTINKEANQEKMDPHVLKILQQFEDVFQEPKTLRPERSIDHSIDLLCNFQEATPL